MSEYAIIIQGVAGVLALFFFFLTYMNAKTWRWLHVTATLMVFFAGFAFCIYAALTLKTRAAWIERHDKLEEQVAKTGEDIERLTRGDSTNADAPPGFLKLRAQLERLLAERGPVWRGGMPRINPDGTITVLTSPPVDPNLPAPPGGPAKNNIQPNTILHAFREGQLSPDGAAVPVAYIGEFKVAAADDTTVTLAATMPLSQDQINAGRANGTWSLYQTMPLDRHDLLPGSDAAARTSAAGNNFPLQLTGLTTPQYQAMLAPILRDGSPAAAADPPDNVWVRVEFKKKYELTVDAALGNSLDTEIFNPQGQAVPRQLRRSAMATESGKVQFGPDAGEIKTALLPQALAEELIAGGIAVAVTKDGKRDEVFRRSLTDFERKFRGNSQRIADLLGRIRQLGLDNEAITASIAQAEQQVALLSDLQSKVKEDLAKAQYEEQELAKYAESLNNQLVAVQTQLSQLYRSNKALSRELVEANARLTSEIERRAREATAMTP